MGFFPGFEYRTLGIHERDRPAHRAVKNTSPPRPLRTSGRARPGNEPGLRTHHQTKLAAVSPSTSAADAKSHLADSRNVGLRDLLLRVVVARLPAHQQGVRRQHIDKNTVDLFGLRVLHDSFQRLNPRHRHFSPLSVAQRNTVTSTNDTKKPGRGAGESGVER